MGVSGCGKSSVGIELSNKLGLPFYDGDDYHPQSNIDKMAKHIPLDDKDREPWLETLHQIIARHLGSNQSVIVASSALKASYRIVLRGKCENVIFVYLKGDYDLIYSRMKNRSGHYMKAEMLRSQFTDLEEPEDAMTILIDKTFEEIVLEIIDRLNWGENISDDD